MCLWYNIGMEYFIYHDIYKVTEWRDEAVYRTRLMGREVWLMKEWVKLSVESLLKYELDGETYLRAAV